MEDSLEDQYQFEMPDFDAITEDGLLMLLEWTVKNNGKWRVHKSDPDCIFPSDFHAHRIDAEGILDLYTGVVYSPKTKKRIEKIPRKVMKYIVAELDKTKEIEFTTKCEKKELFSFN